MALLPTKLSARLNQKSAVLCVVVVAAIMSRVSLRAQDGPFHHAPASALAQRNPYAGQADAVQAGQRIYARNCGACHGRGGAGNGNIPPLVVSEVQSAPDGAIFWYITRGDKNNGMPSWAALPEQQRWKVIRYIKSLRKGQPRADEKADAADSGPVVASKAPPPQPPFTDYRFEKPGTFRHITLKDLPAPYASESATNGPKVVGRPSNAWPKAPAGFRVQLYATGLTNPRLMRMAPNGDIFLAETSAGNIKVFRGITSEGKPQQVQVFAAGLNTPSALPSIHPGRIRNGCISRTWIRLSGFRITKAI